MATCAAVTQSHALQADQETDGCLWYLILTLTIFSLLLLLGVVEQKKNLIRK